MLRGLLSRISQVLGFSATHATNVASPEGHSFGSGEVLEEDYQQALNVLNQYQLRTTSGPRHQPAFENPKARTLGWLQLLGCGIGQVEIPEVIHVAGTKGKGTTCYYCNHILMECQKRIAEPKKIGCLTSPHQMDVRERIMINNEKISKSLFTYYVRKLDTNIRALSSKQGLCAPAFPGYPGFLALLGIYIFILEKVDIAIIETGVGGERDSTNIFPRPIATGITTIGIDHVPLLGHTIEEIAWHKAGIFKSGSIAATVPQVESVLDVLQTRAKEKNIAGELQVITDESLLECGAEVYPNMHYQRLNASLAIFLAESFMRAVQPHFSIPVDITRSLQKVVLLGRSQVVKDKENTWFISSSHNEISIRETIIWFQSERHSSHAAAVLIFNHGSSKSSPRDPYPMLKIIYEAFCKDSFGEVKGVIFCTDQYDHIGRGKADLLDLRTNRDIVGSLRSQNDNVRIWKELGGPGDIAVVNTATDAVRRARESFKGTEILVTGSAFLSGNVLHILQSSECD